MVRHRTGGYPYASGLRFAVNASAPAGRRISGLEVNVPPNPSPSPSPPPSPSPSPYPNPNPNPNPNPDLNPNQVNARLQAKAGWSAIDPAATYAVVTNSFIAGGKDGYALLGEVKRPEDTYNDQTQARCSAAASHPDPNPTLTLTLTLTLTRPL